MLLDHARPSVTGICFESYRPDACCLCGALENLTGEHKIKASAIRAEFGAEQMLVGQFDDVKAHRKFAQGPKSKALQFTSYLCADCNGARTQAADREFDRLHSLTLKLIEVGEEPIKAFENPRYLRGSTSYLNLFRYFAKLLCCHISDVGAPRPIHMSRFAVGEVHTNCVWLRVDKDWTYQRSSQVIGPHSYAAHGGLSVYLNKKTGFPTGFHSAISVGPVRYVFYSRLTWLQRQAIRIFYRQFCKWCIERAESDTEPMSLERKMRLGLDDRNEVDVELEG